MVPPPRTAPPPPAAPSGGTARWLNLVTTTLLGAVVLVVVAAALPSLLRAGVRAAGETAELPPPVRERHPTRGPREHPHAAFPFAAEPPEQDIDEPPDPRAVSPNDPRVAAPRFPGHDRDDDDPLAFGLRSGITLKPLLLRDRRTGAVLHTVKPGEPVSVLREEDEWLLVVHRDSDDLVTGWARRNELLLR